MFTGIIEDVGRVAQVEETGGGRRLLIESSFSPALTAGQSIAVNGACLTVTATGPAAFAVTAVPETLRKTTIGQLRPNVRVNLERAMPASGRFEGHIVQGHVDGTCPVTAVLLEGRDRLYSFAMPPELRHFIIPRGSIALDGISLTVARLGSDSFTVAIIPHTYAHTIVRTWQVDTPVNIECDLVGKYVVLHLEAIRSQPAPLPIHTHDVTGIFK